MDMDAIRNKAKKLLSDSRGSHDWEHTERVYKLAELIAKAEGADMEIVRAAALLHDIGRSEEDRTRGESCHAQAGAKLARDLLLDLDYDKDKINEVIHCIETHRYRNSKIPVSKEAKVLFDADKLDAIGAVGIGRAFLFAGEVGACLHDKDVDVANTKEYSKDDSAYREFLVKLQYLKDKMQTEEGKRLAAGRHRFMVEFFDRLNKEVDGII